MSQKTAIAVRSGGFLYFLVIKKARFLVLLRG
jgi:hypothetical protein